jgi:hypothetical protein
LLSRLRCEILEHFAYEGKVSKSMVEEVFEKHVHNTKNTNRERRHHRPELLTAFAFLESAELIKKINTNPGPGLVYGRGRPKTYYTITKNGLRTLIDRQDVTALKFWKILFNYAINNKDSLTLDETEELYHMFVGRYLRFHNRIFSSQLNEFSAMRAELEKTILQSDKITAVQKVIEVLSINPKIPFEELVKKTGESEEEIRLVLTNYSYTYYSSSRYSGIFVHNIINTVQNIDKQSFELSLFGLMLSLELIRNHELGVLRCGLFFEDFSQQDYYDKIASKYIQKLPLIFGKWNELRKNLQTHAAHNFDVVLAERYEIRSPYPINFGGNKEFCEGVRKIISYNGKLMSDFAYAAIKHDVLKVPNLYAIYWEVMMLADPSSLGYHHRSGVSIHILRKTEETFADEITTLYYMNLCNNSSFIDTELQNQTTVLSLERCLSVILENDPILADWFSKWMEDLLTFQDQAIQYTKATMRQLGIEKMVSAV